MSSDLLPVDPGAQRAVERHWLSAVRDGTLPAGVRGLVRASWARSLDALVPPDLRSAPIVLQEPDLHRTLEEQDWHGLAQQSVERHQQAFLGVGHILTLFDGQGRMLSAEGDPAALEGLAAINFRPGADWSEASVGTNGPGTALATRRPTHIVGAEHFCARWQPWHCAAVPVRHPSTATPIGVLDISGFRTHAHPHTLNLALALTLVVEQSLAAREVERRYQVMARFSELAARYPGDRALAVDSSGRILSATMGEAEPGLPGGHDLLAVLVPELVRRTDDAIPREVPLPLDGGRERRAVWHPVFEGRRVIGGCLLIEARRRAGSGGGRFLRQSSPRSGWDELTGQSDAMREVLRQAGEVAHSDLPVLIAGESGTGKGLLAECIHRASLNRSGPLVTVNCANLPASLAECGFEAASGGSLYLDGIDELPLLAQAELLRLLPEEGEPASGDPRIIASTRSDLSRAVEKSRFRPDLFHRLNVLAIELPPLRHRPGDVALLARRFAGQAARDLGRPEVTLMPEVLEALQRYAWPGNVRELKNLIRRLLVHAGDTVRAEDLPRWVVTPDEGCGETGWRPATAVDHEDAALIEAVRRTRTMAEAAASLGITRSTLYRRMARYGLKPGRTIGRPATDS